MASHAQSSPVDNLPIDKPSLKFEANELPDDQDMGLYDPNNILFVNMEGSDLGERFRERIEDIQEMLRLTHQMVVIHCGIQVKRRKEEGQLPSDDSDESRWLRATYRARVLDTYISDGVYPWLYSPYRMAMNKAISVERHRFHWELLSTMLVGIVLPRPLAASIEALFHETSDVIKMTEKVTPRRSFWNMLQVCTYDEVRDDVRFSIRVVDYALDENMQKICRTKHEKGEVDVNVTWDSTNYSFNEMVWRSLKHDIEKFIAESKVTNIRDPATVPV